MANPILEAFQWGAGGAKLTPEQVARQREIAASLMKGDPAFHNAGWLGAIGRGLEGAYSGWTEGRADRAETAGRESQNALRAGLDFSNLFGGGSMAAGSPALGGSPAASTAMATAPAPDMATARVAQAHNTGAAAPIGDGWLNYANQGATRNLPLNENLVQAMSFLPELGVTMKVVSGGQVGKGEKGGRVGSTRHDHGNAADVDFFIGDRKLTPRNEADRAILSQIVQRGKAAGVTGWGEGDDYMGSGRVHLGFGNPGVWGAGGRGANAPEWLTQAYNAPYEPAAVAALDNFAAGDIAGVGAGETAMLAQEGTQPRLPQAAPQLPEPTMVQDMPVADVARALTGATVNPDLPMAGNTSGFLPVAQSLAAQPQGGGMPPMQQIMELASSPWATDMDRQIAGALIKQQMEQADPYNQARLEKMQLETEALRNPQASLINAGGGQLYNPNTGEWISAPGGGGAGEGPAAFQTLAMRAQAAGLQPGTPEYQQFMAQGGRSPEESAANQRIERLTENLMSTGDFIDPMDARNIAVGIADGRLRADRHPITGVLQVVDMATGQPAYQQRGQQQPTASDAMLQPAPTAEGGQFGQQYPNAPGSFGVEGAAQGAINRVTDTLGVGPAYPDVAQTQADFAVLRESLLNDIASSYGRQPPSWLLKEIRDLTPEAGSVFQGPGAAQSKLNALGRHLTSELENTNRALQRDLSPTNRQEMEARQQGLIAGLERVNGALQSFGGQGGAPEVGTIEDGYRFNGGDPANPNSWEQVQ